MTESTEVVYRPATADDIPLIVQVAREMWDMGAARAMEQRHGQIAGRPWQEHVADSMLSAMEARVSQGSCIVAEVNGHLAGWASWSFDEDRSIGTVGYNGVHPQFRGHGIGTELVRRALEALRAGGMRIAAVTTGLNEGHAAARAVYERLGFKPLVQSVHYTMEL